MFEDWQRRKKQPIPGPWQIAQQALVFDGESTVVLKGLLTNGYRFVLPIDLKQQGHYGVQPIQITPPAAEKPAPQNQ